MADGTRAARREQAVEALLDATLESLATEGFAATTTRGVAQRAGVSQGLQQHYGIRLENILQRFSKPAVQQNRTLGVAKGNSFFRWFLGKVE